MPRHLPQRGRTSLLLWLTCFNLGCVTWRPVALPAPEDSTWALRHDVRITDQRGTRIEGSQAERRGDRLVVLHREGDVTGIPLAEVTKLEQGGVSTLRTIGAVYLLLGAIALVVVIARPPKVGSIFSEGAPAP